MSKKVLLSIKPEYAEAIFSGAKRFEYRKAMFKQPGVAKIYVYSSSPVCRVVGEFSPSSFLTSQPSALWHSTKHESGISKEFFDSYFAGRAIAHAIEVGRTKRYAKPRTLKEMFALERPPQSFQYIE